MCSSFEQCDTPLSLLLTPDPARRTRRRKSSGDNTWMHIDKNPPFVVDIQRIINLYDAGERLLGIISIFDWDDQHLSDFHRRMFITLAEILTRKQDLPIAHLNSLCTTSPIPVPATVASCGIADCPVEILSQIFEELVDSYYPGWATLVHTICYGWMPILWVCRHWRAIALNTPYLFRYIDFEVLPDEWHDIFLRQSKAIPLCISLSPNRTTQLHHAIQLKPSFLSQIRHICLDGTIDADDVPLWNCMHSLTSLFLKQGPVLESFFSGPTIGSYENIRRLRVDCELPSSLWTTGMFPSGLRLLIIDFLSNNNLTADHFILAFANLHQLEVLWVSVHLLYSDPNAQSPRTHFELPSLQSVHLYLMASDYPKLVPLLPIPHLPKPYNVTFRLYPYPGPINEPMEEMLETVLDFISRHRCQFSKLRIDVEQIICFVTFFTSDNTQLSIEIERDHNHVLSRLLETGDPSTLTNVIVHDHIEDEVHTEDVEGSRGILDGLQSLTKVDSLTLKCGRGPITRDLLVALGRAAARLLFTTYDVPYLSWPALTALRLESIPNDEVWGVSNGSSAGFFALALIAINTPHRILDELHLVRSRSFAQQIRPWARCISKIVIEGTRID